MNLESRELKPNYTFVSSDSSMSVQLKEASRLREVGLWGLKHNGTNFVVADPDMEFEVKVELSADVAAGKYICHAFVDGEFLKGYQLTKYAGTPHTLLFNGWDNTKLNTITRPKFSFTEVVELGAGVGGGGGGPPRVDPSGTGIEVKLWKGAATGRMTTYSIDKQVQKASPQISQAVVDKKSLKGGSTLGVVQGKVISGDSGSVSSRIFEKIDKTTVAPMAVVRIFAQTAFGLQVRGCDTDAYWDEMRAKKASAKAAAGGEDGDDDGDDDGYDDGANLVEGGAAGRKRKRQAAPVISIDLSADND